MAKSKIAKYRARRNPSRAKKEAIELATSIGAGFAGYGAARLFGRIVFSQAVRRWPGASKHLHVLASAASAAGIYIGTRSWSKTEDYHEAASIGAGIALLQSAIQTYLPKFGWVVSDVDAAQYSRAKKQQLPDADMDLLMPGDEPVPSLDGGFDLDALLAEHPDIEAVPVGRMAPAIDNPDYGDDEDDLGNAGGFGDLGDLENYNGLMN